MGRKYTNKLQSHRVLILGGTSGMGYAVAEAALEHGAHVIISSSNQTKLDNALFRLREHAKAAELENAQISGKTCDLADPITLEENIESLLKFATQESKLDHVVFTAGDPLRIDGLQNVTVPDIQKLGMVRVTAPIIVAKYLPKYLSQSLRSSYTVTGGAMMWRPAPGWSVLVGVAGGIESLARGLAVDLKPVRVNCVRPGTVQTELHDKIPKERLEGALDASRKAAITNTIGKPEELAEVYLYFMKNTFTTGTVVGADGGRLVGDSKDVA